MTKYVIRRVLQLLIVLFGVTLLTFILINAAGKVFSVGGDLVEMKRAVDEDDIASLARIAELVNTISQRE